jgi:hypothetical protein
VAWGVVTGGVVLALPPPHPAAKAAARQRVAALIQRFNSRDAIDIENLLDKRKLENTVLGSGTSHVS